MALVEKKLERGGEREWGRSGVGVISETTRYSSEENEVR